MIVLGIDPGSRKTGYAVIRAERFERTVLDYGTLVLTDLGSMPEKLVRIFDKVRVILGKFVVDSVAVEAGFYGKNAQSAYKLGYARSAAVLSAALKNIEVIEYSPRKVKQAVTGNGNASKSQVKYMVRTILRINDSEVLKEDEADACAVAICHVQSLSHGVPTYKSWKDFVDKNRHLVVESHLTGKRSSREKSK